MSILQKNKKAAAGIGVTAAAAAVLALGAGTYAAFTDTENAQATFAAGTLDLEIGGSGEAAALTFENISPGWSDTHEVTVNNVGTIDGVLSFNVEVVGDENGCTEPEQELGGCNEGGAGNLAENITVNVPGLGSYTLAEIDSQGMSGIQLPAGGGGHSVEFTFSIADTVDNVIQSDKASVTIEATLTQATNNS